MRLQAGVDEGGPLPSATLVTAPLTQLCGPSPVRVALALAEYTQSLSTSGSTVVPGRAVLPQAFGLACAMCSPGLRRAGTMAFGVGDVCGGGAISSALSFRARALVDVTVARGASLANDVSNNVGERPSTDVPED